MAASLDAWLLGAVRVVRKGEQCVLHLIAEQLIDHGG
jgi:hypothetical protein